MNRERTLLAVWLLASIVWIVTVADAAKLDQWHVDPGHPPPHDRWNLYALYSLRNQWQSHHLTWREIVANPGFAKFPASEKEQARDWYLEDILRPLVMNENPADEPEVFRDFYQETGHDLEPGWKFDERFKRYMSLAFGVPGLVLLGGIGLKQALARFRARAQRAP